MRVDFSVQYIINYIQFGLHAIKISTLISYISCLSSLRCFTRANWYCAVSSITIYFFFFFIFHSFLLFNFLYFFFFFFLFRSFLFSFFFFSFSSSFLPELVAY